MIIGNLGSIQRADVGAGGSVRFSGGIEIEFWVRAGDRWQDPSNEISVRDALLAFSPVLRTSLRVPGGDIITSVYSTVQGQRELVAFDLLNQSSAPVAIGFVVRAPSGSSVTLEGTVVRVGTRPVLYLPGIPVDTFDGSPVAGDVPGAHVALGGTHESTFVFALIHRSSLRAAALLGVSSALGIASTPVLSALPDADMVARGWALQAGEAARIDGDEARAGQLRSLATSMLLHTEPTRSSALVGDGLVARANLARGLVAIGVHNDALALIEHVEDVQGRKGELAAIDEPAATASILSAVITVARHLPDVTFATSIVPLVGGALEFLHRSAKQHPAAIEAHGGVFLAASRLFERVDEHRAAKNSFKVWQQLGSRWPLARASEPVMAAVSRGAALVPVDLPRAVNAVMGCIDGLVVEQADGSLELFSGWKTADLLGRRLAIHHAETPYGKLSVAIRWHGARPAFLWEIVAATADPVVLRCEALDPKWSTREHVGEALLAEPAGVE